MCRTFCIERKSLFSVGRRLQQIIERTFYASIITHNNDTSVILYAIHTSKYIYMPFYKVVSFYPLCQLVSDTIHIKIIQELQTLRF